MALTDKLTQMADTIREKTGSTEKIPFQSFPEKIGEVYASGKTQGEDELWDSIQNNGARTNYTYAFYNWGSEYIRPSYKVVPQGSTIYRMFARNSNLKTVEKAYFDLSQASTSDTVQNNGNGLLFESCSSLQSVEDIGVPAGYYYRTFYECSALVTIEALRFNETTLISNAFSGCTSLMHINNIEGYIGQDGLDLSDSRLLSKDTHKKIVEHLSDNSEGKTVTFSLSAVNKAFESSKDANDGSASKEWDDLPATKLNWTISLV